VRGRDRRRLTVLARCGWRHVGTAGGAVGRRTGRVAADRDPPASLTTSVTQLARGHSSEHWRTDRNLRVACTRRHARRRHAATCAGDENRRRSIVRSADLASFIERAEDRGRTVPSFARRQLRTAGCLRTGSCACAASTVTSVGSRSRARGGSCPSCARRRMAETAVHLVDRVPPIVPIRQRALSLPRAPTHDARRRAGAAQCPRCRSSRSRSTHAGTVPPIGIDGASRPRCPRARPFEPFSAPAGLGMVRPCSMPTCARCAS
jgi:hypothetical protein